MGINKMSGSPWHTEVLTRKEDDPRRHRARCKFHSQKDNFCLERSMKCVGSAHCKYYKVAPESTPPIPAKIEVPDAVQPFKGIKLIAMSDIVITKTYPPPAKGSIEKLLDYYKEHGKFDKPIVVSCKDSKYVLEYRYLRYYTALSLGLKYIPARIGTFEDCVLEEILHRVGKRVNHKQYGNGRIIKSSYDCVEIKFDSGTTRTFGIKTVIDEKIIKPI